MGISIQQLNERVAELLNDEEYQFWESSYNKKSIQESCVAVKRLLNSSGSGSEETAKITLSKGSIQTLPDECERLISVIGGDCGGRTITEKSLSELNGFDRCWESAEQIDGIEFYAYDKKTNRLWVYPNAIDGDVITISFVKKIELGDDSDDNIDIDEEYINDIINYCLFRSYQREGTSPSKENFYRTAFYDGFGLKIRMDNQIESEEKNGL